MSLPTRSECPTNARRITTWPEAQVAEWIFRREAPAWTLEQWLQLPVPRRTLFQIPTATFPRAHLGPGDIDVLAFHPARPDLAVAFECKRITVKAGVFENEFPPPGRLPDFTDGYQQANCLRSLGFHRVFLLGLVAIDCTERADLGGLTGPLVHRLAQACPLDHLRRGVGVAFVEISQYNCTYPDRPHEQMGIDWFGGIGVKVVRDAWRFRQPQTLTSHLVRFLQTER